MRLGCDTGGTFTDLVVEDSNGRVTMYKAPTTPGEPARGVLAALELAARAHGESLEEFLKRADMLVHGTTHAINAVITGTTARTAFLTTRGHRDMLVLREGGRAEPFNHATGFPEPYVPRSLTFEVPERVGSDGAVLEAIDEQHVLHTIDRLKALDVEAVAVCLLWSVANPVHELRIGELLEQHLPDVPFTLSHALSPALREYRRASASCIDASLKPLMARYLAGLEGELRAAGFAGRLLVLTSQGGMLDGAELARAPIHAINSGPSAAPVAGEHFARLEGASRDVIVADTGGTTYDVGLVRDGRIPWTRESWIGAPYRGHMTGFPAVDVKSVGAGGGSIAWVDDGRVLHVGPQSAGAVPGPVCYGRGGLRPTLTDACLVLGYLDPDYFLGGTMRLERESAFRAVERQVARPLGLSVDDAAAAIVELATENMVQAIADITINQGIDPAQAVLVGGGGAAGFNCAAVARRLGCPTILIPELGAALSAAGALMTDLADEHRCLHFTRSDDFDRHRVARVLEDLAERCRQFAGRVGGAAGDSRIEFAVEARYPGQVWEIEVPVDPVRLAGDSGVVELCERFHAEHRALFAIEDRGSAIEFVSWTARVRCRMRSHDLGRLQHDAGATREAVPRSVHFAGHGRVVTPVHRLETLEAHATMRGPAIVETPFTTIVVDPGATFRRTANRSLMISPERAAARHVAHAN
jgi:N-methylhydantoinase A